MQNPGGAVEFTPAKRVAFRSRDINDLSIRKAIRADLAIIGPRTFRLIGSGTDTSYQEGADDESARQRMNSKTGHFRL